MIKLSKAKSQAYEFGDIAQNISERAEPKDTKLDIYVGLEHLDPDCIHIKRKGKPADVKGTKLRVYPGDIIFGKRRAYQRKAALVDFHGICSAHAMVVRANPKVILPALLPFFMHSDAFMHRAVDVSEGSLSPTIKWKILAQQEFKLPQLDDQECIAGLLWSIDETIEKKFSVKARLEQLYVSCLKEVYSLTKDGKKQKVGALCRVNAKTLSAKTDPSYRFKYLDISSILAPNKISDLKEYSLNEAPSRARRVVSKNSIVLSLVRPYFQSFVIFEDEPQDLIASTGTAVLDVVDGVDSRFLFHVFFTKEFLAYCEQRMNGSNYPAISPDDVKNFELIVPASAKQRLLGDKVSYIKVMENKLQSEIEDLIKIKQQIINKIFE